MRLLKNILILLFLVLFAQSCTTEIKLARSIEREPQNISVLCEYPDFIYLTSSMRETPEGLSQEEESAFQDSLYVHSDYIRYMNDTLFLRQFKEQMREDLQDIGVNYYESDELNQFLASDAKQYIVSFRQLEVEERWEPFHAEETFDEVTYKEDFWIKGLSLNAWVDIAKVNDTVEIQQQLYFEGVIKDDVDGMFFQNQWTGEVHYQYRLDTLQVEDIGELKYEAAEEFSYLIFNFIANKEIRDQLNYMEEPEPVNYWKLSPKSKCLIPTNIR